MERRDMMLLLVLLGGGAYYTHAHWDAIRTRLGLDDLQPGRIHAIELCKEEFTFDRGRKNGIYLDDLLRGNAIELVGDLWTADHKHDEMYIVHCRFRREGELEKYDFVVNVASGLVTPGDAPAQPGK